MNQEEIQCTQEHHHQQQNLQHQQSQQQALQQEQQNKQLNHLHVIVSSRSGDVVEVLRPETKTSPKNDNETAVYPIQSDNATPYRIEFSYRNVGKYFRKTKRIIRWSFGLINRSPVRAGNSGAFCEGEVYDVELRWSVHSGKVVIIFNSLDISKKFQHSNSHHTIDVAWLTHTGREIRIKANAESNSTNKPRRYNLLLDGKSFFDFPEISNLEEFGGSACDESPPSLQSQEMKQNDEDAYQSTDYETTGTPESSLDNPLSLPQSTSEMKAVSSSGYLSIPKNPLYCENSNASTISEYDDDNWLHDNIDKIRSQRRKSAPNSEAIGFRLNLAGFRLGGDQTRDELELDFSTSPLDSVRSRLMQCLPQMEDIVSRAILNAFCSTKYKNTGNSKCNPKQQILERRLSEGSIAESVKSMLTDSTFTSDPYQVEADILCDAFEWVHSNKKVSATTTALPISDSSLRYFQNAIDNLFGLIVKRKYNGDIAFAGDFDPELTTNILLNVASILGFEFAKPRTTDTLLFYGLPKDVTSETLREVMSSHGDIIAAAVVQSKVNHERIHNKDISTHDNGFGFIRFASEYSTDVLISNNINRDQQCKIVFGSTTPTIYILSNDGMEELLKPRSVSRSMKTKLGTTELQSLFLPIDDPKQELSTSGYFPKSRSHKESSLLVSSSTSTNIVETLSISDNGPISFSSSVPHLMGGFLQEDNCGDEQSQSCMDWDNYLYNNDYSNRNTYNVALDYPGSWNRSTALKRISNSTKNGTDGKGSIATYHQQSKQRQSNSNSRKTYRHQRALSSPADPFAVSQKPSPYSVRAKSSATATTTDSTQYESYFSNNNDSLGNSMISTDKISTLPDSSYSSTGLN